MTLEQIARLYVLFKTLQPEIKEWIASDEAATILKAIAARFVLSDEQERKLPILVLRLVTQDLPPESFKAETAKETGIDDALAKEITEAVAKEVIGPVAAALRYGGVDTNLLGFNAPPAPPSGLRGTSPPETPSQSQPGIQPSPAVQAARAEKIPDEAAAAKPFILHEEPRTETGRAPSAPRAFSYGTQSRTGPVPPRVVIERVVHYSNFRTPLNVAGTNGGAPAGERPAPKLPQSKWFA